MLAQLNEPNARLGKNWLSRFLDRHPDLKTARNRGLDSKRITAAIPSQIEGWFAHVDDVVAKTSSLYSIDAQEPHYHWQVVQ